MKDYFFEQKKIIQWNAEIETILKDIATALNHCSINSEKKVCSIIEQAREKQLCDKNRELLIFDISAECEKIELENNSTKRIFLNRTVDEVIDVYENVVFYLRRLEFGFPIEECQPLVSYIINEKLSIYYIYTVIGKSYYLQNKEFIANRFKQLMELI